MEGFPRTWWDTRTRWGPKNQLSNEKNPRWLGYIGDKATQVYRDYNKPLYGSLLTNQDFMESNKGFFSWLSCKYGEITPPVGAKKSLKPIHLYEFGR